MKTHTIGNVNFKAGGRVWTFTHIPSGYSLRRDVTGGFANAEKVARIIDGSFKRNDAAHGIDNLARTNIFQLLERSKPNPLTGLNKFYGHLFSHVNH